VTPPSTIGSQRRPGPSRKFHGLVLRRPSEGVWEMCASNRDKKGLVPPWPRMPLLGIPDRIDHGAISYCERPPHANEKGYKLVVHGPLSSDLSQHSHRHRLGSPNDSASDYIHPPRV